MNYSNLRLPTDVQYTSYSDMREYCMKVKDCNLKARYTDVGDETIITYEVDGFDEIYFYNRAEAANSDDNTFLTAFLSKAHQRGYTYEFLQIQDEDNQMRINTEHREHCKIEELLSAPDITKEEADILKEKTNRREDTKADKLKLNRFFTCKKLGVDTLDQEILEDHHHKYHRITNFLALLDENNIKYSDDNQHEDLKYKMPIPRELIASLGYKNMFDRSSKLDKDAFTEKVNSLRGKSIFLDDKVHRRLFNIKPKRMKELNDSNASLKKRLGYLKTVLAEFGLTISIFRTTIDNKEIRYYKLKELNNISEVVQNRKNHDWKFEDQHKIFQLPATLRYQHLIKAEADPFTDEM